MDGNESNWIFGAGRSPSCKPALVCEEWRGVLGSIGPAQASEEADFSVDETEQILFALAVAVEQRDRHTAGHCERLAWICVALGVTMGLNRASLVALYRGGYLHDVGKVGIPDSILFKPGKLTAEEWLVMRSHTARGEEICRPMRSLAPVLPLIRHHHERWDGSGYPDGLRGDQIPRLARVLQIADIFDSLTSPRPYKPAFSEAKALGIIQEETDRGWRDPETVKLFLHLHRDVISGIGRYRPAEPGSTGIDASLANLRQFLASQSSWSPPLQPRVDVDGSLGIPRA